MTLADQIANSVQRIDQWLWFARIAKSRTLAQALIVRGKVRINGAKRDRVSQGVKAGDVITISLGPRVRVLEVRGIAGRRGPAVEAALLYLELTRAREPINSAEAEEAALREMAGSAHGARPAGSGRPTKRDRRAIDRFKGSGG